MIELLGFIWLKSNVCKVVLLWPAAGGGPAHCINPLWPYNWRSFTDAAYYTVRCCSGGMYKGYRTL